MSKLTLPVPYRDEKTCLFGLDGDYGKARSGGTYHGLFRKPVTGAEVPDTAKSRRVELLLLFFLFFSLAIQPLVAAGLTLFSYQDDQGQLIVVDSLERIPEKYRASARESFIPSFRNTQPHSESDRLSTFTAEVTSGGASDDQRVIVVKSPEPVVQAGEGLTIIEPFPEEEPPDPALASAALILEKIQTVINNNELLYTLTIKFTIRHPAVSHQHLTNLLALRAISDPNTLVWIEPNTWSAEATIIIDRLRSIQYTVSSWFENGSAALLTTLPTLIEASRRHADLLEKRLKELEKADEERRAKIRENQLKPHHNR